MCSSDLRNFAVFVQADIRNVALFAEKSEKHVFGYKTHSHQYLAELAPSLLLFLKNRLKLFGGNYAHIDQEEIGRASCRERV